MTINKNRVSIFFGLLKSELIGYIPVSIRFCCSIFIIYFIINFVVYPNGFDIHNNFNPIKYVVCILLTIFSLFIFNLLWNIITNCWRRSNY